MGRAAAWLENALEGTDVFPRDARFDESGTDGHVRVSCAIEDPRGERKRNALVVVLIDALVERWDKASEREQERIFDRAVELLDARLATYDPNGRVDVPAAIHEGSF